MNRTREYNNNWRGGRIQTAHGYILIRVGLGHPLADCRGYAYEHRLVVSQILGRWIKPNEKVHHKDTNRLNNIAENLLIVSSNAEHYYYHRKNQNRRKPGEMNVAVLCRCNCGGTLSTYDKWGRPRKYISGHNPKNKKGCYVNVK